MKEMIIESLELKNYRNYRELKLPFHPGSNLLYGDNAQGKTNILEALYLCAATKSHRGSKDRELIRFGEEEAHIRLNLIKNDVPYRIDMHLKKERAKGIAVNGVPIRRASELFGTLNVVLFSPEDLSIVKNGPSDRRRFCDMELCQLDRSYVHSLVNYNKALLQRNRLLKDLSFEPELAGTLEIWDSQLIRYGSELIRAREAFIEMLDPLTSAIHGEITSGKEKMRVSYEKNISVPDYEAAMKRAGAADRKLKTTTVGPHRDDIGFFVNEMDLRKFGSQGQQRTGALSLKLSEIELMKRASGDWPVLLLDDVLSELDTERQRHLLNAISRTQTVLTSTGMENLMEGHFRIDRKFRIMEGTAEEVLPEQADRSEDRR